MAPNYERIAHEILEAVGKAENVISVENCMTRLRFNLKDNSKANKDALEKIEGVQGVVILGSQFQVVLGTQSADIFKILTTGNTFTATENASETVVGKTNLLDKILDVIVGSLTPIIWPIVMTGGLLQAIAVVLSTLKIVTTDAEIYKLIMFMGQGAFYFIPVFLGYSAAKKMNTNVFLGMLLGGILLYPDLASAISANGGFHIFGIQVPVVSYGSTILPILLGVWVLSYVERWIRKIMPKDFKNLLTPLLTTCVMVPLTLLVIGPLGGEIGSLLAIVFGWMGNSSMGWLVVAIIAGLCPILVMTGMHLALIPLVLTMFKTVGYDSMLLPAFLAYNTAAATVALAVGVKSKNKELKAIAFSASISGYLGITEPSLYGIAIRLKRPMVGLFAGGAIAGLVAGILHFKAYTFITAGLLALPSYVDNGHNFLYALIIMAVSIVATFLITYFYGFEDPKEN